MGQPLPGQLQRSQYQDGGGELVEQISTEVQPETNNRRFC